jgi:hypothetical protein
MEEKDFKIVSLTDIEHCAPEYQKTIDAIDRLRDCILDIRSNFLDHMNKDYLSYDIEIDGKEYSIRPAFTIKEQNQQWEMKQEIFALLLKDALEKFGYHFHAKTDGLNHVDMFRFILHPMRVERHELLMDQFAKSTPSKNKDLHQDTQIFSKDYEDILRVNPKYFLEQAYKFIHEGPDSIDEELLEFASFRRVLHNYMVSDACTKERDRLFNMKTVDYFPELRGDQ